ncbi:PP2C family protein-serine/threonine phosphatase [Nonomuraea glycinis]|uniref:PP2C family protein-serine/threonine phosphatase n=1 Tax=Nonomuraea glycinis TaxID=2047744 RepID=UPI002E15E14C|nr:serine/threonine-protein phosphatase [Nonomuraea glycinis]
MLSDGERMLGGLLRASHTATLEDVVPLVAQHAGYAGFTDTQIYVADLQGEFLVPLPGQADAAGEPLSRLRVDGTVAGRAFRDITLVRAPLNKADDPDAVRLWAPLLDGTERVGVVGAITHRSDETTEWRMKRLGTLLSLMVVSKRHSSDTYAQLVRTEPMTLSAEVLWNLLPNGSFANDKVVLGGALEPAYQVGGDAFDYGITGDLLHLTILDAMGHDLTSGLTATIATGACRNSRLQGVDLLTTSEAIDEAIADQFRQTRFATGILADLNMTTGELTWVNRGHHPPLVIRDGRLAATLESKVPAPPMGFRLGTSSGIERYQLHRGDRLLFYTDGIIEAQSPEGEMFGLDRFIEFIVRHEAYGMSAPETLRRLIQSILRHQHGRLQDDATVLTVEWQAGRHVALMM